MCPCIRTQTYFLKLTHTFAPQTEELATVKPRSNLIMARNMVLTRMATQSSGHTDALWPKIYQKTAKLNIFVSNRQKLKKFRMNTVNVCSYFLTTIFLDFFLEFFLFFFLNFFFILKKNNKFLKLHQQGKITSK